MANLKVNMSMTKNPMPEQNPVVRAGNFDEVALGYDADTAMKEAARCLDCKNTPCREGCPVAVKIPRFLEKVREGDFEAAYEIVTSTNSLPAVCGRVCPQEKQCESKCVRGLKGESVGIGRLERFVADWHMAREDKPEMTVPVPNGHRVAVIGSGPAGLTCAGDLCKMGYDVTIFEAFHKSGGVLVYGIPQFRLPKEIVAAEIENLTKMGVKIVNNAIIGKSITVDELFDDGFEAVFIGSGAGLPQFLRIPGENLLGVYSANELLTRTNLMKAYRDDYDTPIKHFHRVAVVGAGNVAMDAARVAKRLGAEHVYITYRRGPSVSGPSMFTSPTAAAVTSCPPVRKRSSMPRPRASSSSFSTTPAPSAATRTAMSPASSSSVRSSVSPTKRAAASPLRLKTRIGSSMSTPSSSPSAPARTLSSATPPTVSPSPRRAASRPMKAA